jgi:hypothetical protein
VDLDGDGIGDIITGCWPGELYFFKGNGKGEFAAPVKIQREGKEINLGRASTVFAADWRGTGQLDLLVGNMEGDIYLVPNDGTKTKAVYGTPRKLEAAGKPIKAPHGDSQPIVADWDRDGLVDLILACGDGSVVWYRNVGTKTEPKLAAGVTLVKAAPTPNYNENTPPPKENKPGMRAKACVVDWNGDGYLDLLVGDFGLTYGKKPELTEEDKKIEKETNAKMQELQKKLQPYYDEYFKKIEAPAKGDDSAEAKREREKEAQKVFEKKEVQELQKEQQKLFETMRKFQRPYTYQGNVWVYLRKASATKAPAVVGD